MVKFSTPTAVVPLVAFVAGGAVAVGTGTEHRRPKPLAQVGQTVATVATKRTVKPSAPKAAAHKAAVLMAAAPKPTGVVVAAASGRATADDDRYHGVKLGTNASLGNWRPFPDDCYWNTPIDHIPVDTNSRAYISTIGLDRNLHPDFGPQFEKHFVGIPYVVVSGNTPRVPVRFEYADESDHELYPIPPNPPIEGYPNIPEDGDRHLIMVDRDNWRLFELIAVSKRGNQWTALSGAVFNLKTHPDRPLGWTSADAAGLPIFPALVKWEEVYVKKEIRHALRFTVPKSQRAYVPPARHFASRSSDVTQPPMGLRVRLKASFNISGFSAEAQVVLKALKKYGMILADNGSPWFIQGAPDPRWDSNKLADLKRVKGSDLEVIQVSHIVR